MMIIITMLLLLIGCNDTIQISQYISSIHTVYLNGAKFLVNFFFTILRAWIHFENGIEMIQKMDGFVSDKKEKLLLLLKNP